MNISYHKFWINWFDEDFLECEEFGNFTPYENGTNLEGSASLNSARKTGTTGIFSIMFLINAHSYLHVINEDNYNKNLKRKQFKNCNYYDIPKVRCLVEMVLLKWCLLLSIENTLARRKTGKVLWSETKYQCNNINRKWISLKLLHWYFAYLVRH